MNPSKNHKNKLCEILQKLENKGLFVINMDKLRCIPDGIAIDFKRKRVYGIEIEVLYKGKTLHDAKEKTMTKYHNSNFIPLLITVVSEKEEKKIRY